MARGDTLLLTTIQKTTSLQKTAQTIDAFYLTPVESTIVTLQTHTADFQLRQSDQGLILALDARYRLKNPGDAPVTIFVKVAPASISLAALIPDDLTLTLDQQALALTSTENASFTTQVAINADSSVTVRLTYSLLLNEVALPLLNYSMTPVQQWGDNASIRVSIQPSTAVPGESWLYVVPEGYRFAPLSGATEPAIKWLYDAQIPGGPFQLRFIHPDLWSQINQINAEIGAAPTPEAYVRLGDLYQQLWSAVAEEESSQLRDRFYAQALAAYTAAIAQAGGADAGINALEAHLGMATLYRKRILGPDETAKPQYAQALVAATQAALQSAPTEDGRRQELLGWLSDGLNVLLTDARRRRDWQAALNTVDQLSSLPPEIVNSDILSKTRRALVVQQALQFLEQENRDAAIALAGQQIVDTQLLPPDSVQTLFARWQMTATITPTEIQVEGVGIPLQASYTAARDALTGVLQLWQSAGVNTVTATLDETSLQTEAALRFQLTMPTSIDVSSLLSLFPPNPDLALLRALLSQLSVQVAEETQGLRQALSLSLPVDLRSAADQWRVMAANLEKQAAQFDQQGQAFNPDDPTGAENVLRARIQAANYRAAAQAWQRLIQNSWVAITLHARSGLQTNIRTWLLTAETPAQLLEIHAQALSYVRLLGILLAGALGLTIFSGILWWLF